MYVYTYTYTYRESSITQPTTIFEKTERSVSQASCQISCKLLIFLIKHKQSVCDKQMSTPAEVNNANYDYSFENDEDPTVNCTITIRWDGNDMPLRVPVRPSLINDL